MAPISTAATVRRHRLQARLSVAQLAERAGLSEWTIYEIERGNRPRPQVSTLSALADALDVDITILAGEEPAA